MKELYFPGISIPHRLRAVKNCIAIGMLVSIIVSWRLWTADRLFPQVPLFDNMPLIPVPYDKILFGLLIALPVLLLLFRKPRFIIISLLLVGVYMVLTDQNRLQPWFFQYLIMLFVLVFYNWRVDEPRDYTVVMTTLKIVIAATYLWSGIQKLNPGFMAETWPWLIKPIENICTAETCNVIYNMGWGIPYIELLISVCLFFPNAKRIAIPVAVFMHFIVLVLLVAHSYNPVVWGWHITMIMLVYFMFAGQAESKYYNISYLFGFKPVYAVIVMCALMPLFSLINKWDTSLSAGLYPGNTPNADIYLSDAAKSKLPYYLKYFTISETKNVNVLHIKNWAMQEMGVPGYPGERIFEAVEHYIKQITCCDDEVSLIYPEKRKPLEDS